MQQGNVKIGLRFKRIGMRCFDERDNLDNLGGAKLTQDDYTSEPQYLCTTISCLAGLLHHLDMSGPVTSHPTFKYKI